MVGLSSAARPDVVWRVLEYGGELVMSSHLRDSVQPALGDVDQVVLTQSDSNLLMTIERCTQLYWFIILARRTETNRAEQRHRMIRRYGLYRGKTGIHVRGSDADEGMY